jgi:hypothetical protein
MIGTDLNLTLPDLAETMAENVARIRTALSSIEDSIATPATPAALNITSAIDMRGNSLTDVASLVFTSGNASGTPGTLFYYDGDWYVVDAVGMIQLTDGGQLNAASVGGIQGDYGGVNPAAVTFVDASAQYQFTHDTGEYADVVVRDVILQGLAGTVTLHVDNTLTGDRDINFKTLPASGKSLLVYDAATSTLEDNDVTRVTNDVLVTDLDANGNIEAATFSVDADRILTIPPSAAVSSTATHTHGSSAGTITYGASAGAVHYPVQLPVGAVIKSAKVYGSRSSTGQLTLALIKVHTSGGVTVVASDSDNTASSSFTLEVAGLTETVLDDGSAYALRITPDGSTAQFTTTATVNHRGRV